MRQTVILGGNRDNGVNAGSRASNWNNYVWNSNWNIGCRFACEHNKKLCTHITQGLCGATIKRLWSACLSRVSKYIKRSVKVGVAFIVKAKNSIKEVRMGRKYNNIFEQIVEINNLRDAYIKAVKGGNRYTTAHLKFKENLEANLYLLQQRLINGTYTHGKYHTFKVYEPKERLISSLPFRDRIVQHAINNILQPIFEKVFYPNSYACRPNKGTHKGVKAVQATIRRLESNGQVFYLKMDFSKYFHSIDRGILFKELQKKISDKRVLKLLKLFGDEQGVGIPIGNLLSQLFANLYGHIFDRFIKTKLKAKHYFRYMDDTVILSNSKQELYKIKRALSLFSRIYMKLKFSHWHINPMSRPLNFLGYRMTSTYKLIRKDSVVRAKRKIKLYKKKNDIGKLKLFLASWSGHLRSADSFNLKNYIKKEVIYARYA